MKVLTNCQNIGNKSKGLNFEAKVHIIDGFLHADTMEHFAKSVLKRSQNVDSIDMHYVECNHQNISIKQMQSVLDKLKSLSSSDKIKPGDFLTIPGLAPVSIGNIRDRIEDVFDKFYNLTAQNIKVYKDIMLQFLKEIYENQSNYWYTIRNLDKNSQGLEYTYGVIQQINRLVNRGVNVYLPAGHGADETIKWMAKQRGVKPELYKYIAEDIDKNHVISGLLKDAENNNYYDFNLLSLANAHIVNIKKPENKEFIFHAKDGFVNDSAEGVYNFSPIRDSMGNMKGYGFHDDANVDFPYNEYAGNKYIENLNKYVGKSYYDFVPTDKETATFKQYVARGLSTSNLPDKLYEITDVYAPEEIKRKKLDLLGRYIDREQKLVLDKNVYGRITFSKTNCEGSERPSVVQMWGSCFSTINAIKRDLVKFSPSKHTYSYPSTYIDLGDKCAKEGRYIDAEEHYNNALEILNRNKLSSEYSETAIEIYEKLYDVLEQVGSTSAKKGVANMLLDLKSYKIKDKFILNPVYIFAKKKLAKYYEDIARYCEYEGEHYSAKVCKWAAQELRQDTSRSDTIVQRRAEHNQYIGDLYDACH